jgi:hypothetical protein
LLVHEHGAGELALDRSAPGRQRVRREKLDAVALLVKVE